MPHVCLSHTPGSLFPSKSVSNKGQPDPLGRLTRGTGRRLSSHGQQHCAPPWGSSSRTQLWKSPRQKKLSLPWVTEAHTPPLSCHHLCLLSDSPAYFTTFFQIPTFRAATGRQLNQKSGGTALTSLCIRQMDQDELDRFKGRSDELLPPHFLLRDQPFLYNLWSPFLSPYWHFQRP